MAQELDGKVAIVTGGANGIGRAIVEAFVVEGARVVIADLDEAAGEDVSTRLGERAAFKRTDVSNVDDVQGVVDFTIKKLGELHVMVNNAGIASPPRRFMDDDLRDFDRVMGVDLYGVIVGTQRAVASMG